MQQAVSEKRRLFSEWYRTRKYNDQERYRGAKQVLAIANENAYSQLYEELKGKEGRKQIYKLANAMKRMATDIGRVTKKDKAGALLTGDDEVNAPVPLGSRYSPVHPGPWTGVNRGVPGVEP